MNKVSMMKWAAPAAAVLALAAASAPAQEITPTGSAVTASTNDGNLPQNAVDNNLATRWSANGDGQWIQFDLGMVRSIGSVSIAWYSGNTRTSTFDIQVSDCCGAWQTVRSATSSGTTTAEQSFDFPDVTGRYVRYLGHGNSVNGWNSLSEVSIFAGGAPPTVTPPPAATPTPTSPGATPTPTAVPTATPLPSAVEITPSTATASTNDGNLPQNAVDNNLGTRWSANGDGQWLQVDLGSTRTISYVRVAAYNGNTRQNRFDIQFSGSSSGPWTNAATGLMTSGTTTNEQTFDFADVTGRYVRYLGHMNTVNGFNSVTEFSVFGSACASCPTPTPAPTAGPTATPAPTATPGANWRRANLTNFTSYPDPNSEECIRYNGCQWAGQFAFVNGKQTEQWVRDHNIAAVHERDANAYRLKNLRLRQGTRQIDVTVYDMCADSDCSGCCTDNANDNGLNFLIDIEKYTMQRFGSGDGIVDFLLLN